MLLGDHAEVVTLDGSFPALRPCRYCGDGEGFLTEPKGPHGNGVRCNGCRRHLGWLPCGPGHDDDPLIDDE